PGAPSSSPARDGPADCPWCREQSLPWLSISPPRVRVVPRLQQPSRDSWWNGWSLQTARRGTGSGPRAGQAPGGVRTPWVRVLRPRRIATLSYVIVSWFFFSRCLGGNDEESIDFPPFFLAQSF